MERTHAPLVPHFGNTVAFERRCIPARFVRGGGANPPPLIVRSAFALLGAPRLRAAVGTRHSSRLAIWAPRRSRCMTVFPKRGTWSRPRRRASPGMRIDHVARLAIARGCRPAVGTVSLHPRSLAAARPRRRWSLRTRGMVNARPVGGRGAMRQFGEGTCKRNRSGRCRQRSGSFASFPF
jgi:hypothetical protein